MCDFYFYSYYEMSFNQHIFNPFMQMYFVLKMLSGYHVCCVYLNAPQNNFTLKANTLSPDQSLIRVHVVCFQGKI